MPSGARWVLDIIESTEPTVAVKLDTLRTERREFIRCAAKPKVSVVAVPIHRLDETVGNVALGSPDVCNNLHPVQRGNDPIDSARAPRLAFRVLFGKAVQLTAAALGFLAPESFDIRHDLSLRTDHAPRAVSADCAARCARRGGPTGGRMRIFIDSIRRVSLRGCSVLGVECEHDGMPSVLGGAVGMAGAHGDVRDQRRDVGVRRRAVCGLGLASNATLPLHRSGLGAGHGDGADLHRGRLRHVVRRPRSARVGMAPRPPGSDGNGCPNRPVGDLPRRPADGVPAAPVREVDVGRCPRRARCRPGRLRAPRASRSASWFDAGRHAPGGAKPRFLATKLHGFSAWVVTG